MVEEKTQKEIQEQAKQILDKFSISINETTATSGFQAPNARILDRAQVPLWPTKPKKIIIVGAAMVGAFIFALAFIFISI